MGPTSEGLNNGLILSGGNAMRRISIFKISMLIFVMCFLYTAPGFSEVHIYDANDQYLGVYMASFMASQADAFAKHVIEVFNPYLGNTIFIQKDNIIGEDIFFNGDGCTGKPYVIGISYGGGPMYCDAMFPVIIRAEGCQDKYYITINNDINENIPKSYIDSECNCKQVSNLASLYFSEVSEFPKSSFPFTLPFALPLKMKYSAGGDINGDAKIGLEEAVNALQITSGLKSPGLPTGATK
jgi:hypothetical protein